MNPIEQWFVDRHPNGINMTPEILANDFAEYFTGEMLKQYGLKKKQPS